MLHFFRQVFSSKIGVIITLAFVGLIALAFASADVTGSGNFGGIAGGDRAAMVGKERISTSALSQAATSALENMKQENPKLSMKAFLAGGGLDKVLDEVISRTAIGEFGKDHGIIAGDRLVDSEIAKIPGFRGLDGKFSETAYRTMLQQRGLTDALVREDLAQGLIAKQVLVPAAFGAVVPRELVTRYAALLREHRTGSIAMLPSAAFAPKTPPGDAEIAAFYARKRDNYITPERRVIRYATFDDTALKGVAAPSAAEIAARYQKNHAQYAAAEIRKFTQLILPTQAGAQAVMAELAKGATLESAAASKGLKAAPVSAQGRQALAETSSPAVADAAYGAARGKLVGPVRSGLGWHVMRVDGIEVKPERSLAAATPEIQAQITAEKRRAGLIDLSARIEDEFDNGGNLADVAREMALTVSASAPITADGQVYGQPGKAAPPELARVIQTAFAMERENQPQLAEVVPGKTLIVFDVTSIAPSAAAPITEIRPQLIADFMLEKGTVGAKAAADKVLAQVRKGADLGTAMASLGMALPPVDRIQMGREQLNAAQGHIPPPLALLFSMAQGTVKSLAAPGNRGWYVVALRQIVPGTIATSEPLFAQAQRELGGLAGREYAEELRRAIREEVGVSRNATAIKAVGAQLTGSN